ncbi:hypothetical protein ACH0B6_17190 [Solibacillus silvestris]
MRKVLLALGEENFSALFRKEFDTFEHPAIAFDVLTDEVLSRNFLEPLTKMYTPDYVVIHDTFLSTTVSTANERDEEIIQILKSIRLQSDARIVYICQRDNSDYFLSQLVALGIYDIFNEQAINTVKFMHQVSEPAKLSNVLKWTNDLAAIQAFDVQVNDPEQHVPSDENTQVVEIPKKSFLSHIKRFSPFKTTETGTLPLPEESSLPKENTQVTVLKEPIAESETLEVSNVGDEHVNVMQDPFIEPKNSMPVQDKEELSHQVKTVSVEDIFTEPVQAKPTVQVTNIVPRITPDEIEAAYSNAPANEEATVYPSIPSTFNEDFLLSKTVKVDVLDTLTESIDSKKSSPPETTEPARTAEPISPAEPKTARSLQVEDHIAQLSPADESKWQHFIQSHEPFQARGQYATTYAIGHLARDYSTTQFAINCAVLLREQYNKVALVELNQNLNLEYVQAFATGAQPFANDDYYFEAGGITHFKFKVGLPLQEILQRFDAVVLDLGMISNLHPYKSYFERGNYRLLLTPTYQWSWHLVDTFIHYDQHALIDYQFIMFNAAKHDVMNFKRIYGNRVHLHALGSISRLYDLSEEDKQAIRPLVGLKKGNRLKKALL